MTDGGDVAGNWSNKYCPEKSWVKSAYADISTVVSDVFDDLGMFYIYFSCFDKNGNYVKTLSSAGDSMSNSTHQITQNITCEGDPNNYFCGYKLRTGGSNIGMISF